MKRMFAMLMMMICFVSAYSQNQYPIKTIYRGDSVVILTIQQSNQINSAINKANKNNVDYVRRIQDNEEKIEKLEEVLVEQNIYIDSLSNLLQDYMITIDSMKTNYSVVDSLWKWALGPTLIYTQYPDDSTVYLMDLSNYYMTTNDFGVVMERMSYRQYERYQEFIKKYGLTESAFWQFRNEMKINRLPKNKTNDRKVWKWDRKVWQYDIKE